MEITTISTGSKGNCYILKSSNGKFCIIDCGVKFQSITNHNAFTTFTNLDFVFCSHEHKDHNLSVKEFESSGCETITYYNSEPNKTISIGQWKVRMFHVKHNALNYGLIIYDTVEKKTFCYATDFIEMPKIQNVDYWLYEINYDEFTVDKVIDNQDISKIHVANNIQYHNSLENAMSYFSELNNKPKLIIACHISNMGGTKERIIKSMNKFADRIEIATKGKTIKF